MRVDLPNLPCRLPLPEILQYCTNKVFAKRANVLDKGQLGLCRLVEIDSPQQLPAAASIPELQSNMHHLSLEDRSVEAVMGSCALGCLRVCSNLEWLTLPYECYLSERRRTVCMGES